MDKYTVRYGTKRREFESLQNAVFFAREKARTNDKNPVMSIWRNDVVVIGVVTDDANALTLHRLKTWREDEEVPF